MTGIGELPEGEQYSAEAINAALAELPQELAQQVLAGIVKASGETKQRQEELKLKALVFEFAGVVHQQRVVDQVYDAGQVKIDPISWHRGMVDGAAEILRQKGAMDAESTERVLPESVLQLATVIWVNHQFETYEHDEEEMDEILEPLGYSLDKVHKLVMSTLDTVVDKGKYPAGPGWTKESMVEAYDSLDQIPVFHVGVIEELAEVMRADLLEQGYKLLELGPDKTYGYDEEYESAAWPEPKIELLPN